MKTAYLALACALGLSAQPALTENPVKKKLAAGGVVIGGTITASNVDTASIMADAGFDFLWIEGEHSPISLETTRNIIMATKGAKAMPFTRVPVNELWTAKRVLDIGSLGVIFPFTNNPELARRAVAACKYPPVGDRGAGPSMAMLRWPGVPGGYPKWANDNVMVITIIERKEAVDKIEEIAAVPGIDVLFIGLNDLSYSLGVGGVRDAPEVKAAVKRVMAAAAKHKIPVGGPGGAANVKSMIADGYRFIQGPSDLSLLQIATREFFSNVRKDGVDHKDPIPIY